MKTRVTSAMELGVLYLVVSSLLDWKVFFHGPLASMTHSLVWHVVQAIVFVFLWILLAPLIVPRLARDAPQQDKKQ